MALRVGVVLSGCGFLDGAEITESVSILIALDQLGAKTLCFAPDLPQPGVVNHRTHKPEPTPRNMLAEAARIARGQIADLKTARAADLDALIFPGGFGAARNLSTFADAGPNCSVLPDVARLITDMHAAKKPIGLACIAPVLAARVLAQAGLKPQLTLGADPQTARSLNALGAVHCDTPPDAICLDETNRLVSTPCYMNNVGPAVVYQGARRMVETVLRLAQTR